MSTSEPETRPIRLLVAADIPLIAAAFAALGWHKPAEQYARYLDEQTRGEREVLVALRDQRFAGYVSIVWRSPYPPFAAARIPEIMDLNVLPVRQHQGIGAQLLDRAEERIV
jgi:GNAT superfamily N-acetyltransferase